MAEGAEAGLKNLVVLGGAQFGREVAWQVGMINAATPTWNFLGFWTKDEEAGHRTPEGWPCLARKEVEQYLPDLWVFGGIGDPLTRLAALQEAEAMGCRFATLFDPGVRYHESLTVGPGSVIGPGNVISVNVKIGSHVIMNANCVIGHDCVIEDFATISPGCLLSGDTRVRRGAYLGVGCITNEHTEIGEGAVIGSGAVVVKDIPAGAVAMGVPARPRE